MSKSKRPRVAVVCAYNPKNAGMYSVDLAAVRYFSARDCAFDLFVTQTGYLRGSRLAGPLKSWWPTRSRSQFGEMTFRRFSRRSQLDGYSHVVYWGDFTNNPAYGLVTFPDRDLTRGHSRSVEAARRKWLRLYALAEGRPAGRVVSAGQNFQADFAAGGAETRAALAALGRHFDHILPRDTFSLENLRRNLPEGSTAVLGQGMDCAFLLEPEAVPERSETFCYHFGRSGFAGTDALVAEVERATGYRAVHLKQWFALNRRTAAADFRRMRREIQAARFVLTDTYHVSVNAMTVGTPVYGLGRFAATQAGTLGDFKKRVLFEMLDAAPFYLSAAEGEDEAPLFARTVARIGEGLHLRPETTEPVRAAVGRRTDAFRDRLDRALFG